MYEPEFTTPFDFRNYTVTYQTEMKSGKPRNRIITIVLNELPLDIDDVRACQPDLWQHLTYATESNSQFFWEGELTANY